MTRKQTVVTFTIDVPTEDMDRLGDGLAAMGVRFDPAQQVIVFNDAMLDQAVAMGHHLPGMLTGINEHLDEGGLTPRIPTNHEEWSIERRHAFLQFAIDNFNWEGQAEGDSWWKDEGKSWEEMVTQNPLIFKK